MITTKYYSVATGGVATREEDDAYPTTVPADWTVITQAAYDKAFAALDAADVAARASKRSADCAARKAVHADLKKNSGLAEATCRALSGWKPGDC